MVTQTSEHLQTIIIGDNCNKELGSFNNHMVYSGVHMYGIRSVT